MYQSLWKPSHSVYYYTNHSYSAEHNIDLVGFKLLLLDVCCMFQLYKGHPQACQYKKSCNGRYVMYIKFTYVFLLHRNFEILILVKPGRDRSVTTAKVSSTNQLQPGSDFIRSLYF